jgi:GT2 family glycosyltransferase
VTGTPVSVIVVSRGRPRALARCLRGLAGLDHDPFEVVVIADPAGLAATGPWQGAIKSLAFDTPNISRARNLGLSLAAGSIVAFIDDDAVPEPTWLSRLAAPFADDRVGAAGGNVIGRNGIALQWGPGVADRLGRRLPLDTDPVRPQVHRGNAAIGIKTEGTNMAFRRDLLAGIGGFDERFAFYLDETDVNLRLGARGVPTAVVPLAQVHHAFAESERRRRDRVPRDLSQIGASLAVFLAKHGTDPATRLAAEDAAQRRRLLGHMVAGRLEPRDVGRLLATFHEGWAQGLTRRPIESPIAPDPPPFLPFRPDPPPARRHINLSGRPWQGRALRARAAALAAEGNTVSLVILSPTALFHRVAFTDQGYWLQTGGLFGRALPDDPLLRYWRFRNRVLRETERVRQVRVPSPPP